ncbi:MAG: 16S rRNA (guanine(527)-N(7))-methyltransferase RsmG [Proteobacteria bacterium]|nr:16S rRNA (guanine(527)-N(7))-methyltransferase RsmG [Pseudomonadota bacterium]
MSEDLKKLLIDGAFDLGVELDELQVEHIFTYMRELKKWNEKINLTSIVDDREIIIRHFLDSLVLCKFINDGKKVLDMGSGGGFPGLVLKIARPKLEVTCMDKVEKKVKFMRHIIRTLGLNGARAVSARAEDEVALSEFARSFDVVVSRAFAGIEDFLTLSLPFLNDGGRVLAVKGPKSAELMAEAREALSNKALKGFTLGDAREISIPPGDRKTTVITFLSKA